ncbi:MAG: ABC transporter permease [Pseudonocardia sp.]
MSDRIIVLATTEAKLVFRNKTVAVSSVVLPVVLGIFWLFSFSDGDQRRWGSIIALQLAVVLAMSVYVTATQTVVARRHHRVLKRLRTSGISDTGLLVATVAPGVAVGLIQLLIFTVINVSAGAPLPADPLPLALALLGGLALSVTAALATSVVTPSPERAQITTLPLTFVLLGGAIALSIVPLEGWWQTLVAVPGASIGQLSLFAFAGGTWADGLGGLPALLPAVAALLIWPVVFGTLARRRFRWDQRN